MLFLPSKDQSRLVAASGQSPQFGDDRFVVPRECHARATAMLMDKEAQMLPAYPRMMIVVVKDVV